jgi:hypothetical protein
MRSLISSQMISSPIFFRRYIWFEMDGILVCSLVTLGKAEVLLDDFPYGG